MPRWWVVSVSVHVQAAQGCKTIGSVVAHCEQGLLADHWLHEQSRLYRWLGCMRVVCMGESLALPANRTSVAVFRNVSALC